VYDADQMLVVTSPMPMLCRTIASPEKPVLTVVIEIEIPLLRELLVEIDAPPGPPPEAPPPTVFRAPLSPELEAAGARLLSHLADAQRTRVLARPTIREILYLLLETRDGRALRAITEGPSSRFAQVLRYINTNFAARTTITELAEMAGTSVPTFHQRFKAMTSTSPLRYMKDLRLTRARQMLREGGMVKLVAQRVGYESESQFSREYRRFFGEPPSSTSQLLPRERS
jgi:AraC-like DNA-binding protein